MIKTAFHIVWIIGGMLFMVLMTFALIAVCKAIGILNYLNAWLNTGALEELLQNIMRGV